MESTFEKTKLELELLTNIDILQMVEKRIWGGICHAVHRYINNKYSKNY